MLVGIIVEFSFCTIGRIYKWYAIDRSTTVLDEKTATGYVLYDTVARTSYYLNRIDD